MKDVIVKKSAFRTVSKIFVIIDIVLDSLALIAGILGLVFMAILGKQAGTQQEAQQVVALMKILGIVGLVVGLVAMAVSIVSLNILKKSESFALILTFAIINIITGIGVIAGIFMILVACIDCTGKNKNKAAKAE